MDVRPKILSIDDNASNQKLIEQVLSSDYEVKAAMSGISGIEVLQSYTPDAILLDVDMPQIDGFRICRMIRSEPIFEHIPILFVSCLSDTENHLLGYQVGGDDYIDKPIDISLLKEKLDFNLQRIKRLRHQQFASNDSPTLDHNIQYLHDFLLELITLGEANTLANKMLATLSQMGLRGAIHQHFDGATHSSIGPLSDLETILLEQAKQTYPMDHSARYIWGSRNFGAIIQNMPNPKMREHRGLRQVLTTLFNACDSKFEQFRPGNMPRRTPTKEAIKSEGNNEAEAKQRANVHGYKLECALEILEGLSESNLSTICHELQNLANDGTRTPDQYRELKQLIQRVMDVRLSLYDQCLEVQTQYQQIMEALGASEAVN